MSEFYDLNKLEDCQKFIWQLMDGYTPYQLGDFSAEILNEAIWYRKDQKLSFNGNRIYEECTFIYNRDLNNSIEKHLNENLDSRCDLSEKEQEILQNGMDLFRQEGHWDLIVCKANGECSELYLNADLEPEKIDFLNVVYHKFDILQEKFDELNTDIENLEEVLDLDYELEQNKEEFRR